MVDLLKKLQLINSSLESVNSKHKNLSVYRDSYNKLFDEVTDNEDSSTEILQILYTVRDYILELESLSSDLLNLVTEFGLGYAQDNTDFVNNMIKNYNSK